MRIIIRHQISETYEEIYFFEVSNTSINYNGVYFSRRDSSADIWGYDWEEYFESARQFEINHLRYKANLCDLDGDSMLLESNYANEYRAICDKYNPIMNKTKDNESRFGGVFCNSLWKEHPPKMPKEKLKELIEKEISKIIEKAFNNVNFR